MRQPGLYELNQSRHVIGSFKGLNKHALTQDGEFTDMFNMSSSESPILAPRSSRGNIRTFTKPNGVFVKDGVYWVDGTKFYRYGVEIGTVTDTEKQFVGMGAYLIILPDKKYYHTVDKTFGDLEKKFASSGEVKYTISKQDGVEHAGLVISPTQPSAPNNGAMWLDTGSTPNALKQYSSVSEIYITVPTTYVKIAAANIHVGFKVGDSVTISGSTVSAFNSDMVIQGIGSGFIVVTGIIDAVKTQTTALKVERLVPTMDFITESDNRLWGCSSEKHELYACKLGDPFNWRVYQGLANDSYAVTIGTDGAFTGAISHLGNLYFFKENCIHTVRGNKPSNFQVSTYYTRGVQKGSNRSLTIVNENLYYKSGNDICSLSGGIPFSISDSIKVENYKNAAAGACDGKYYISMQNTQGTYELFVYDSKLNIWHKEDNTKVKFFAVNGNDLLLVNDDSKQLLSVKGYTSLNYDEGPYKDETRLETRMEWYAETGNQGLFQPNRKFVSQIQVRFDVEANSSFTIEMQYDSSGRWERVYYSDKSKLNTGVVPIVPRRCDHYKIRFSGTGKTKIYYIANLLESGGTR